MKKTTISWIRGAALALTGIIGLASVNAATITYDGITYTTSGSKATVKKYTVSSTDSTKMYKGDIVIPETFEYNGATYTVVATGANAFVDCKELTSLKLPATCVTIGRNSFKDCTALTVDPTPSTATSVGNGYLQGCTSIAEVTVPVGVAGPLTAQNYEGMTSLKKFTIADADAVLKMNVMAFLAAAGGTNQLPIEELYIGRNLDIPAVTGGDSRPFRGNTHIKKVTFGGSATAMTAEMFQGCSALEEVVYVDASKIATMEQGVFAGCSSLKSLVVPPAITAIPERLCYNDKALTAVTMGDVTTIGSTAFYNTGLTTLTLPTTVTTISSSAYQKSALQGVVKLPVALQAIGSQAFADTKISGVEIPATVTSIGAAAFAPITTLADIKADGNTAFKVENGVLLSTDGTRLLVSAHQGGIGNALTNATVTSIDNYGLAYAPFESVDLPALQTVGNYGFANSKLKNFTLKANVTVGSNIFSGSALENLVFEDGRNEIPQGIAAKCTKLSSVTFPTTATNIMKDAFAGCTALAEMEIPANVNYMEPGSVPTTIRSLRVLNPNTPALAANVFNADQANVVCKVAPSAVDKYKAAAQWCYLSIVADETITASGMQLGCPTGLYFATPDGKLMYKDEKGELVDTKFACGAHALTLQSYKNRIYVAVAGEKMTYQNPDQPLGDGELFYVNNTNGIFYRVTVLNNVGYKPSEDPFSMIIDSKTNNIYIADRNVGVHKLNADTTGLYGSQPFLFQNQYLPYYGDLLSWGAITGGFSLDSKGIYWRTTKFNGLGLTRFTDADIYPEGGAGKVQHFKVLFKDAIIKTAYIDEANGYYYMFVQKDPYGCKPGIYRIALDKIQNADGSDKDGNENLTIADCQLIDDSPVRLEGAPDSGEIANVAQINGDGENVFWGYIAPATDEEAIAGSVALNAENPLHKSGIKAIKSADATPVVTFAVEGVEAYGVCGATYVAPPVVEPASITLDKHEATVANGGETLTLVATVLPADAENKNVVWTSSDESIATVSATGVVTTVKQTAWEDGKECKVVITATCEANVQLFDTCAIVITNPTAIVKPTSITMDPSDEFVFQVGQTEQQFTVTVLPAEAVQTVVWSTSDETVVTVDQNGLVTVVPEKSNSMAVKANEDRTATVTATSTVDSNVKASCVVVVKADPSGVSDIYGSKEVSSVRYYNVAGMESATPYEGVNVMVVTYTDGSKSATKVVK